MYTAIVSGSRYFPREREVTDALLSIWRANDYDIFIKVGDCPSGVDKFVLSWCKTVLEEDRCKVFRADWDRYGLKAGPIRNHEMVDSGGDVLIAWPLEDSKGTKDCAEYAHSKGVPVWFPDLPAWAQWAAPIAQFREY